MRRFLGLLVFGFAVLLTIPIGINALVHFANGMQYVIDGEYLVGFSILGGLAISLALWGLLLWWLLRLSQRLSQPPASPSGSSPTEPG